MKTIFISYRRNDTKWAAQRLYEGIIKFVPKECIFLDIDSLPLGRDFVSEIERRIDSSDIALVLIGTRWVNSSDDHRQRRRLDDQNDFVRIEVSRALKRDILVVPVLVDEATMPLEHELPDDIRDLVNRQAALFDYRRSEADINTMLLRLNISRKTQNHDVFLIQSCTAVLVDIVRITMTTSSNIAYTHNNHRLEEFLETMDGHNEELNQDIQRFSFTSSPAIFDASIEIQRRINWLN